MKLLHDVIYTHTHLDQDSDVSREHNTTKFNNDLRKNFKCGCSVQNKFRRMISQREKKTFVEALNVVRCVKLIDRRCVGVCMPS